MDAGKEIIGAIYARRSVRRYEPERPVEREKIVELLKAAMAAPSACNIQPWEFVVATEAETLKRLRDAAGENGPYGAPAIIAVCGDDSRIPWKDHGAFDCAAAAQNMMLAAPSLGLGTVVVGGFDKAAVKALLSIPEGVEPVCLLYLGYPAEHKPPRTRYAEQAVHWERFDGERPRPPRPGDILAFGAASSI
jgi:nitroreductase